MRLARHASGAIGLIVLLASCDSSTEPIRPTQITAVSSVEQNGVVGAAVPVPPAVRVLTASGQPVPGVAVAFTVGSSGGQVTGGAQVTDVDGRAVVDAWLLGTATGEYTVVASASGVGPVITFRAVAAPGAAAALVITTQPPAQTTRGAVLAPAPAVQFVDTWGNATGNTTARVTASVAGGVVDLLNAVVMPDASGTATFTGLALLADPGTYTLGFTAASGLVTPASSPIELIAGAPAPCGPALPLDFALGQTARVTLNDPAGFTCLDFESTRNAGQQYLLLLENLPVFGNYGDALFPGLPTHAHYGYALHVVPSSAAAPLAVSRQQVTHLTSREPRRAVHAWDFGAGPIYEIAPSPPPGGAPAPMLVRPGGALVDINAVAANPVVGDTITQVWMEGIPRLGIPPGSQRVIVRHVSDELIIAEDVRLATLPRENGGFNTPLHPDTMHAIAQQYAAHARTQGDLLFDGRHNNAIENSIDGRVLAIHSLMPADNIWGYTYSSTAYFVWDYWVGTDGSTGGLNQRAERNADNLFMHEVAHMRHLGVLQHASVPESQRGNRWLVEGFARFSERLPIAARLLGTPDPSRTGNVVLPLNPAFNNAFFRDDVPTYLSGSTPMVEGYQHSAFVFDYFADQVALDGGDWRAALRELLLAAGSPAQLDNVIDRWLGLTFGELFTRARTALYLDDIGTVGLPAWTQYHQYQLRASRPAGSQSNNDPRNAWTTLAPATPSQVVGAVPAGAAWGFIIDGTATATSSSVINLVGPATANAVLSVTRIR